MVNIKINRYTGGNRRLLQYASAVCVGILQVAQIVNLTWASPVLPQLLSKDSPIGTTLSMDEASWIVSVIFLGALVGCYLLVVLLDKLGPKFIFLVGATLTITSWIIIGFSKLFWLLLIGRFIAGIGDGITMQCISIYICEIASKDIRGRLAVIPTLFGVCGSLYIYGVGPYLNYVTLIISCAAFPIAFLIVLPFMPNSPYFLIRRGRAEEAQRSLVILLSRKSPHEVEQELKEVEEAIASDNRSQTFVQSLQLPGFRKSLLIVFIAQNIMIFCGYSFISSYLQIIVAAGNISLSTEMASIFWGIVKILGVTLSALLIDKLGRKKLMGLSSLGASISLFVEGTYMYLLGSVDLKSVSFLPVLCVTLFGFFISLGILHVPFLLFSELFTTKNTRKTAGLIIFSFTSIAIFLNLKILGSMFDSWGLHVLCWFFGMICFLGALFSFFILPETTTKSLSDIQRTTAI